MRERVTFMPDAEDDEPYGFRLSEDIQPVHYDLEFEFDWQQTKFNGLAVIQFKVLAPTSYIAVHFKGMNIRTESITRVDFRISRRGWDDYHSYPFKKYDYWITWFQTKLNEGDYAIRLRFNGKLNDEQIGMFTTTYSTSLRRDEQMILATRFAPTFARLAFPCFDQPDMKATFTITLIHPDEPGYMAISNMNIEEKKIMFNKTEVKFATTPPICPHMVSFLIANLDYKSKTFYELQTPTCELRVFAEHDKIHMAAFAMRVAHTLMLYLTGYFKRAYPLPKLDLVAIPRLTTGMAEHWGLVFFDQTLLLYDEELNTSANTQHIVMLIAHALVRMWIGCLVTVSWWDQLWLAKGLASYMEYKCVQKIRPEWGIMDQFLILDLYPIMAIEAINSHPLSIQIEEASQIPASFDKISFMKSAALIRMLEDLVGAETLCSETAKFLSKYAFECAEAEDFINVLQIDEPDIPIGKIIKSFADQKGFPFITVTRVEQSNVFRLTQQRFLADPEDYNHKLRSSKIFFNWTIPITFATSNDAKVRRKVFYRHDKELTITLKDVEPVRWIKLNKDNMGYYRVNYPVELWKELTSALYEDPMQFSISDRAQLLSDCFAFSNACLLSYTVPLEMTGYLWRELDFVPWYVAANELKEVAKMLQDTDIYGDFEEFIRNLIYSNYRNMSWTNELSHLQSLLRVAILDAACAFELPMAMSTAAELFAAWLQDPNFRILPDLKGIVLYYGMKKIGNSKIWQLVWDRFNEEGNVLERRRLLHSLSAIKNRHILSDLLELTANTVSLSDEELFKCFWYVSCNTQGSDLVWNFLRKTWSDLLERFGRTHYSLSQLIPEITSGFKTNVLLNEVQSFIDDTRGKGMSASARHEAISKIEYNISWLNHHEKTFKQWLQGRIYGDSFSFYSADDIFHFSTADV